MTAWREKVRQVMLRHVSEPAAEAAASLLAAFHTVEEIASGRVTEDVKREAVQMLVDLTYGLGLNRWFSDNNRFVMPVYTVALNGWLDAMVYAASEDPASQGKAILSRALIVEVATAVMMADRGAAYARENSRRLRDELMAIRS